MADIGTAEIVILVGGTVWGVLWWLTFYQGRKSLDRFPYVSDELFLGTFNRKYPGFSDDLILRERYILAKHLEVLPEKLDVNLTFDELFKKYNPSDSGLLLGDLDYEFIERFGQSLELKETVGEMIYDILRIVTYDDEPESLTDMGCS